MRMSAAGADDSGPAGPGGSRSTRALPADFYRSVNDRPNQIKRLRNCLYLAPGDEGRYSEDPRSRRDPRAELHGPVLKRCPRRPRRYARVAGAKMGPEQA